MIKLVWILFIKKVPCFSGKPEMRIANFVELITEEITEKLDQNEI